MNRPGASDSSGRSWGKFGRTLGRREAGVKSAKPTATPDRERYDPRRFQGQGVLFKGKLIGVLAVTEARGDRMCQDALAELKMAIRAAGEHKQKVVISVNIDGLRLRDERSGDCLYHHPVHKISFIAQDMTDKRAFGYVFGSPDTGHQFFGVKTEKDAGQVVMAMRDLFQVVFELKKQEMEKKKQRIADEQLKAKTGSSTMSRQSSGGKSGVSAAPSWALGKATLPDSASGLSVFSGHSVDLLDLQQEIENIEQGISQMDRMSPTDGSGSGSGRDSVPAGGSPATSRGAPASAAAAMAVVAAAEDPFGDSFVASPRLTRRGRTTSSGGSGSSGAPIAIAPPPPALAKSRHSSSGSGRGGTPQPAAQPPPPPGAPAADSDPRPTVAVDPFDLFTDLDPLGSGKAKPYIDKKDFFSDLKKPAKRRLDELSGRVEGAAVGQSGPQPPRPLDKHTLMELYESEERRKAEASALDSSGELATTVNGASGSDSALFEASFSHSDDEKPRPAAAAAAGATFSTDFSVFDFDAVRTAGATALTGEPEPRRADSPPAFSPPPVPLPPPPSRQRTAASSRSGSSSPATLRRAHLKPGGGSSDTLADLPSDPGEPAPEPPPRPPLVQPPPLPPKKAPQHVTMKPPPRPPHTELRWEASAPAGIATPESGSGSPPLPVPARRPRQTREHPDLVRASSLGGAAVHRKARETASLGFTSLPPLTTEPVTEPPPVNRHTKDRARALAPPAFEPTPPPQPGPPPQQQPPADMLTQLQSTSLTELASKLHISVDRLAQMSVIELAACLVASGSAAAPVPAALPPPPQPTEEESQEESPSEEFKSLSPISSPEVSIYKSPQLQRRDLGRGDALRSPLDQLLAMASSPPPPASASPPAPPAAAVARVQPEPVSRPEPAQLQTVEEDVFARFDARFPRSPLDTPNSVDDFHCEFPEAAAPPAPAALAAAPAADKYAVFRELEAELTGERLAASDPVSDDSDAEPTDAVITPPAAAAADPWSMFSGQPGGADPFRDGYGAAGEPAPVPAVQDFARFDREFGAVAGPTVSALAGAEISWPQEGEPVLDSPTAATGNGWSVASAEDSGLRERGDAATFDPEDHARLGAADSGSAAGIDDHQFGPPDFSAQFGSEVGMFGTAEASRAGPVEAVPCSVSDAVGWGAAVAAVADGEREGFSPAPDSGWERLSSPPAAEPAWQRAETLRAQTSQFDDDFVVSDERGSLTDEVTFDERRRSPLADDVFGGTDPWTTPPTGAAAAPAAPAAAAADPFADDEFFQAPAPAGIQKDPFKQDPFERSWASDFNAGARTQQQ